MVQFVHKEMLKKFPYYRAWNAIDEKFTEWIKNPKATEKQKLLLAKLRNYALFLRAEIDLMLLEHRAAEFERYNSIFIRLEVEKKELKAEILKLKKENVDLLEKNQTQAKTIKSLKAEVEYYEKEK